MVYTAVITFGASAIQLTDNTNGVAAWPEGSMCRRILIEPVRANMHAAYVGLSDVTNDGSGAGVIQELAVPSSTASTALDRFIDAASGSHHNIDPSMFWVHGYAGEKVKASLFTI
jgi:hypothetical protein